MKEKQSHEDPGTQGRITLGNRMGKHGLDRQVEGSYLSNEPLVLQYEGLFLTM